MIYRIGKSFLIWNWKSFLTVVLILFCGMMPNPARAQNRIHTVYYENTDYELHVYRISGKEPGKTLLLIGGIQGDEPGGFLSADRYADLSLLKGNLIVIPRANFQSIVLRRRQINEDMNRKFTEDYNSNYETKIVTILKKFIKESDCLLNLHDGSGFFSEKWEGPDRNPMRYGQSIIADCEAYVNPANGDVIRLGDTARSVSEQINKHIKNTRHHFRFNNHRTEETASRHKEQRKSATYYALYTCGIPAFGIETSKSLALDKKVRYHNLAINAFMERLDIFPETPGINLDPPKLRYLIVSINDSLPVAVEDQQTIFLNAGDSVMISHIEANYERGLSADIVRHGAVNDLRKKIKISGATKIVVKKDYYPCGSVNLAINRRYEKHPRSVLVSGSPVFKSPSLFFKVKINNGLHIFQNYARAHMVRGDTFEIVDVMTGVENSSDLVVNFKGFVGNIKNNTGEDRGYVIHTGRDLWQRYSIGKEGKTYQVVVTEKGSKIGKLLIDLEDPVLNYIVIKMEDDPMHCLAPGEQLFLGRKKFITLMDIRTNVLKNAGISASMVGPENSRRQVRIKEPIPMHLMEEGSGQKYPTYCIEVKRDEILLGSVYLNGFQEKHRGEK